MGIELQDILVAAIGLMLCIGALAVIALPILALIARRKKNEAQSIEDDDRGVVV